MASLKYVTVAQARRHRVFGTTGTDILNDILLDAERWAENYCQREFDSTARTETYNGTGKPWFWVKQWPVSALSALSVTDGSGTSNTVDVSGSDADVILEADNGKISFGPNNTSAVSLFPLYPAQCISVTYTGGWSSTDMPNAIKEAIILYAVATYAQSSLITNPGLKSQAMGEEKRDRIPQSELEAMVTAAEKKLDTYRHWEV